MAIIGGLFGKKKVVKSFFVNSHGNEQTRGIYTFQIDIDTGELMFRKHFKTPSAPTYSFPYGRYVCTTYLNRTGTVGDGGICSYTSTADTLALVSRMSDKGKTYVHACTNWDGEEATKVFAADYLNGEVLVGKINKKKLTRPLFVYKSTGSSVHPTKQTLPHPCYVGFTPDNTFFVVDLGIDKILFFTVTEEGEMIAKEEQTLHLPAGSGPASLQFNEAKDRAYVLNQLSSTVMVYEYKNGVFTHMQTVDTYDKEGYPDMENEATKCIFSEDGKLAFVSNKGHDTITSFAIDADGKLQYVDFVDTSYAPVDMHIFNNRFIVVACQTGGILEVVEYAAEKKGILFETAHSYLVSEPVCITEFFDITERKQ